MQNLVMDQDASFHQMLEAQLTHLKENQDQSYTDLMYAQLTRPRSMDFELLQNLNSLQNLSDEDLEQLFWTKKQWRSGAAKVGKFALHAAPLALAFA